jgi:hypothetical protein
VSAFGPQLEEATGAKETNIEFQEEVNLPKNYRNAVGLRPGKGQANRRGTAEREYSWPAFVLFQGLQEGRGGRKRPVGRWKRIGPAGFDHFGRISFELLSQDLYQTNPCLEPVGNGIP